MKNELELLLDCPVCNKRHYKDSIRIVSARQDTFLVHMSCKHCKSASLAVISKSGISSGNLLSMGMLTDLDYEEACRMLELAPVSADEVLDVQQELSVKKGL